jgi:hypothetical protein
MDSTLKALVDSGRRVISDSKTPKLASKKKEVSRDEALGVGPAETDPHKVFVKRTINEKPKKAELIKDIKKFIQVAEADL